MLILSAINQMTLRQDSSKIRLIIMVPRSSVKGFLCYLVYLNTADYSIERYHVIVYHGKENPTYNRELPSEH
jgi:hypothetical protein